MSHWFEMLVNTSYQQALCCMILLEFSYHTLGFHHSNRWSMSLKLTATFPTGPSKFHVFFLFMNYFKKNPQIQGGPLPIINGVATPISYDSTVRTLSANIFADIYRGPITPFETGSGAHFSPPDSILFQREDCIDNNQPAAGDILSLLGMVWRMAVDGHHPKWFDMTIMFEYPSNHSNITIF